MKILTYSELSRLMTFEERFDYLELSGVVGTSTFGFDRYVNQAFYRSKRWKEIRDYVITRDLGCDLGIIGREIYDRPVVHHMNPITLEDLEDETEFLLNPEFLITTTHDTHNAIHYGTKPREPWTERRPNDTCPWKL